MTTEKIYAFFALSVYEASAANTLDLPEPWTPLSISLIGTSGFAYAVYNAVTYVLAGHCPIFTSLNYGKGGVRSYPLSGYRIEKDRPTVAVTRALKLE